MVRTITKRPKDLDDDEPEPSSGNESSSESDTPKPEKKRKEEPEKKKKNKKTRKEKQPETDEERKSKEGRHETDESEDEDVKPNKNSMASKVAKQTRGSDDEQSVPSSQPSASQRPRPTVAGKCPRLPKKHQYRTGSSAKIAWENIESIQAFCGTITYHDNADKSDSRKYYLVFKEHNGVKDAAWYFGRKIEMYASENRNHSKRIKWFRDFWGKSSWEQWVIKKEEPDKCDVFELQSDGRKRHLETVTHPFPESKRNAPTKRVRALSPASSTEREPKSSKTSSSSSSSSSSSAPPESKTELTMVFSNVLKSMLDMQERFLHTTQTIITEQKEFVKAMVIQQSQQTHSVMNGVTHLTNMVHTLLRRERPNHEPDLLLPQEPLAPLCFNEPVNEPVPLTICEAIIPTRPIPVPITSSSSPQKSPIQEPSSLSSSQTSDEHKPLTPRQMDFNRLIANGLDSKEKERYHSQTTTTQSQTITTESQTISTQETGSQELTLTFVESDVANHPDELGDYDPLIFDVMH